MDGKCVLVTGGTGYIGSHTVLALLDAGASVVIVDNLVNSSEEVLPRMRELAGAAATRMTFVKVRSVAYARGGWKQSCCACLCGGTCARPSLCVSPTGPDLVAATAHSRLRRTCVTRRLWRRCLRSTSAWLSPF